jgi:hypothetical protein
MVYGAEHAQLSHASGRIRTGMQALIILYIVAADSEVTDSGISRQWDHIFRHGLSAGPGPGPPQLPTGSHIDALVPFAA